MRPRVTCVVPARLGSTRFFGKLLTPIFGKPVVVHALERASGAGCFDRVVCLTDSPEISSVVAEHGFEWALSGEAHNGTERIGKSLAALDALGVDSDLFVNLQGDEPAFPEEGLRMLAEALRAEPGAVHILVHEEEPTSEDLMNHNRVKVAFQSCGSFAGFTRAVPAGARPDAYRQQLGAYAYHRDYLLKYAALPPSTAEREMSHEMLRAPGLAPLRAHPARPGASVDVPEDLIVAERALALRDASTTTNPERQNSLQGAPA